MFAEFLLRLLSPLLERRDFVSMVCVSPNFTKVAALIFRQNFLFAVRPKIESEWNQIRHISCCMTPFPTSLESLFNYQDLSFYYFKKPIYLRVLEFAEHFDDCIDDLSL